jgi:hypothetical protein
LLFSDVLIRGGVGGPLLSAIAAIAAKVRRFLQRETGEAASSALAACAAFTP